MRYILRRLVFYTVAAWVSITVNFFLPRAMPGDPASAIFARFQGRLRPEEIDAIRQAYGLTDAPLPQQYVQYLTGLYRGEFGISLNYFPAPVTSVISNGLMWTLLLAGTAVILSFALGNLLGILGAWRRGGLVDSVLPPLLIFTGAFPYQFLALLALYFLSFQFGWFPRQHAHSDMLIPSWNTDFILSVLFHLILPAGTIILTSIGGWMLGMRNTLIGVLAEDYITLAEAKGLPQRRIMFNYAARNALLPNITGFGMALGFVLSGALLTEIVFSYPGLGYLLLQAVRSLDYPLMQGLFLMITFAVLSANLFVDLLYIRLDPRVRVR
ncbi:MAG: ABC transporter permease [Chloroflexi bacterium AL-W]|nr:ABC transporter permease [Chloroflexi bacterium AL-N1]NOK67285.1 ABC transporter permease [Chloroflexi bacterium AL-N10]NOK75221.1 ABC transporter permease [Chloroflexi bacterium AL-N5]NOK82009.1 ABC transporter permease [Chloroflexi bacterium AL-W]NOK89854.1 ABC transporter permease [Chloroflexi bacterium AL-N15]